MKIRILIADDHAVVRMGLAALFSTKKDFEVVGQSKNGEIAVRDAERLSPDVVVMDLMMPRMGGVEATAEIRRRAPGVRILVAINTLIWHLSVLRLAVKNVLSVLPKTIIVSNWMVWPKHIFV